MSEDTKDLWAQENSAKVGPCRSVPKVTFTIERLWYVIEDRLSFSCHSGLKKPHHTVLYTSDSEAEHNSLQVRIKLFLHAVRYLLLCGQSLTGTGCSLCLLRLNLQGRWPLEVSVSLVEFITHQSDQRFKCRSFQSNRGDRRCEKLSLNHLK